MSEKIQLQDIGQPELCRDIFPYTVFPKVKEELFDDILPPLR